MRNVFPDGFVGIERRLQLLLQRRGLLGQHGVDQHVEARTVGIAGQRRDLQEVHHLAVGAGQRRSMDAQVAGLGLPHVLRAPRQCLADLARHRLELRGAVGQHAVDHQPEIPGPDPSTPGRATRWRRRGRRGRRLRAARPAARLEHAGSRSRLRGRCRRPARSRWSGSTPARWAGRARRGTAGTAGRPRPGRPRPAGAARRTRHWRRRARAGRRTARCRRRAAWPGGTRATRRPDGDAPRCR